MLKESPKPKGTVGLMWGPLNQDFKRCYLNLMEFSRRYVCGPCEYLKEVDGSVSWHPNGRNEIVDNAEGEWTLMLDTDHVFQADLLIRLLNEMERSGADVVSGLYLNKHKVSGHVPVCLVKDPLSGQLVNLTEWKKGQRHLEVAMVGGGVLLVKNKVFKRIMKELSVSPFDLEPGLSEDYSFCRRCTELGVPIVLCPQIEAHHTVPHVLSAKDFNFEKE